MLGVCLLFVGIVLINNGMCSLYNVDGKSTAIMNIFTGGLSLFINFVNLVQGNYYAAGTGLLFCFTYLFVALSKFLKASPIHLHGFSTFVAIMGWISVQSRDLQEAVHWESTGSALGSNLVSVGNSLGNCFRRRYLRKKLGKFVPYLQVFEGIVTAWVPGVDVTSDLVKNKSDKKFYQFRRSKIMLCEQV